MSPRPWPRGWDRLARAAAQVLPRARSRPRRAAAILDAAGGIHVGVSIDAASPPGGSLCAEQVAAAAMCAAGSRGAVRMAVISMGNPEPPCGRCLQFLLEFGDAIEIRWGTAAEQHGRSPIERLMPLAFRDYRGD